MDARRLRAHEDVVAVFDSGSTDTRTPGPTATPTRSPSAGASGIPSGPQDASGNKIYIPFGCSGSTRPQYGADIGNPAFRAQWIADARATTAQGYKGLYIDGVNMDWRVCDGAGRSVYALDPRTGRQMNLSTWQARWPTSWRRCARPFRQGDPPQRDLVLADSPRPPPAARRRHRRPGARLQRRRPANGDGPGRGARSST